MKKIVASIIAIGMICSVSFAQNGEGRPIPATDVNTTDKTIDEIVLLLNQSRSEHGV